MQHAGKQGVQCALGPYRSDEVLGTWGCTSVGVGGQGVHGQWVGEGLKKFGSGRGARVNGSCRMTWNRAGNVLGTAKPIIQEVGGFSRTLALLLVMGGSHD